MTPSPHHSTFCLRPLNPTTSHNNNNNNGGLHARVRAAEDIEPDILATYSPCSWVWVAAPVGPCYRSIQKILVSLHEPFSSSSCCVWFLRLMSVYSARALCACSVSSSPILVNVMATYRPGMWTTVFSVVFSGSVWTQIFFKRWRGRWRKKDCFQARPHILWPGVVSLPISTSASSTYVMVRFCQYVAQCVNHRLWIVVNCWKLGRFPGAYRDKKSHFSCRASDTQDLTTYCSPPGRALLLLSARHTQYVKK